MFRMTTSAARGIAGARVGVRHLSSSAPTVVVSRQLPASATAMLDAAHTDGTLNVVTWPHEEVAMPYNELLNTCNGTDGGVAGLLVMLSDTVDETIMKACGDALSVVRCLFVWDIALQCVCGCVAVWLCGCV